MTFANKLFVGCIAMIGLIVFFTNVVNETKTPKEHNMRVTVGYSALRISLPIFVAKEKGFFDAEGLDVVLERFDTAQPLMNSLVAGNISVAGYTALPITYNAMLRSKTDLYFVTSMLEDQRHRISYLIVPSDTPRDFAISDLRGKKIGILPTIAYKKWIEEILRKNNINPIEAEIIQVAPALSPSALESKQVDALFTNDPSATTVLQRGIGRLLSKEVEVPKYLGEPFLFGSFNIRKDFADEYPEITKKIISAMDKAVVFVNENPAEAKEMMKKYLHESQQPFVEFYPEALYQSTTEVNARDFQNIANQYFEIGIIQEPLDVGDLVVTKE